MSEDWRDRYRQVRVRIPARLQAAIEAAGLTHQDLAERAGVSAAHVSAVLRGTRHPSPELAQTIAEALDADVREYFRPAASAPTRRTPSESATAVRERYRRAGYQVLFPAEIAAMNPDRRRQVAQGVTEVLDGVYDRKRTRSAGRTEDIVQDVASEAIHLFVLLQDGRVVATTRFTRQESQYSPYAPREGVVCYEAGGTAKSVSAPATLRVGQLLEAAHLWASRELADRADFLVANTRVAAPPRPPHGRILAQSLAYAPFIPAYAGYSQRVGPRTIEPLVHLVAPFAYASWKQGVNSQTIFTPGDPNILRGMLAEPTKNAVRPTVVVCPRRPDSPTRNLYEVQPAGVSNESIYVMTAQPVKAGVSPMNEIPSLASQQSIGISDRVVVEHDVVTDAQAAGGIYTYLENRGFQLSGWVPSAYVVNRVALVFGRTGHLGQGMDAATADLPTELRDTSPTAYNFFQDLLLNQPQHEPRI